MHGRNQASATRLKGPTTESPNSGQDVLHHHGDQNLVLDQQDAVAGREPQWKHRADPLATVATGIALGGDIGSILSPRGTRRLQQKPSRAASGKRSSASSWGSMLALITLMPKPGEAGLLGGRSAALRSNAGLDCPAALPTSP